MFWWNRRWTVLYTAIERTARELHVEFSVVAAGDGKPSTLETLCAHAPELVLTFLGQLDGADLQAAERRDPIVHLRLCLAVHE